MANTKIVATLGPACSSTECLRSLLATGVSVFRLNASHGTWTEHSSNIQRVRQIADQMGREPAILLDLQGPKIRLGTFEGGGCMLETGSPFTITVKKVLGNRRFASTDYGDFAKDVKPGDSVLLADGSIELLAVESDGISVRCRVISGGPIADRKGINLPGVKVAAPSLTEKDLVDLTLGLEAGVDLVALSFVREGHDVRRLRDILRGKGATNPIISKIEKPEGWENLDAILAESDGVMVARGDLGVELAPERVPYIQKAIIERAREQGKVVVIATQMLESMIGRPSPTRAEASDVANAIYDGTDAVMLSGETSVGKYPVEAARMMARIVLEAESSRRFHTYKDLPLGDFPSYPEIVAASACQAAGTARVAAIATFAASGESARLISRLRPSVPIYAFTSSLALARRLMVSYGIEPVVIGIVDSTDQMLALVEDRDAGGLFRVGLYGRQKLNQRTKNGQLGSCNRKRYLGVDFVSARAANRYF
jgi:pyruvate kinase